VPTSTSTPSNDASASDPQIETLLADYQQTREDDRSTWVQITALLSVAVALAVVLAALAVHTCASGFTCPIHSPKASSLTPIPVVAYLLAPLLPAILMSYVTLQGAANASRSYYARGLEESLYALSGHAKTSAQLPIPSWSHVSVRLTGQTRSLPWAKSTWLIVFGGSSVAVLATLYYFAFIKVPSGRYQVLAVAADCVMFVPSRSSMDSDG